MEKHNITIAWNNGDITTTDICGSRYEICKYYEKAVFTRGEETRDGWREYKVKASSIHFNY